MRLSPVNYAHQTADKEGGREADEEEGEAPLPTMAKRWRRMKSRIRDG